MNTSTFFNRSTGPQSSSSSTSSTASATNTTPSAGSTFTPGASGLGSSSSSSSNSSSANGFGFHFEFPSINLSNLADTFNPSRFSANNLSNLITKNRSTRSETSSPSSSSSSGPTASGSHLIMVCENCGIKFHFLKRKKTCSDCSMDYCVNCFPRDNNHDFFPSLRRNRCRRCRVFSMQPLEKTALLELRIKDLKWYMDKKRIPHRYCKEKSELVDLILCNSGQRRFSPPSSSSYPNSPLYSTQRTTSSNITVDSSPREQNQDNESWVFVENDETATTGNRRSESGDSNSASNNVNSANATTSQPSTNTGSGNREEPVPKENRSYESNSSSTASLNDFKPFNIDDLSSEEQIHELSIRQIKLLLTRNFVDFKGCCEKEELLEKAIRLWRNVNKAKEKNPDELDDDSACKICMEKSIDCVLLECGHVVTCIDCGKRMNECPICRQYVVRAVRIFKS